jgi:hypothetical protein
VLGATRDGWVATRGEPAKGVVGEKFQFGNPPAGVEAAFHPSNERAWHVELLLGREESVSTARSKAKEFHPRDAKPVRTYTAPAGQTVEVFTSEALASVFVADQFDQRSAEPGTFIQIAERGSPRTARVVLGIGDNP